MGTVQGETYGNLFHLAYAMKSPAGGHMEQWLYLQPDGHTVVNEATVTIAGFVAVHLSERITHAGSSEGKVSAGLCPEPREGQSP